MVMHSRRQRLLERIIISHGMSAADRKLYVICGQSE